MGRDVANLGNHHRGRFLLPGMLALLALSAIYAAFGTTLAVFDVAFPIVIGAAAVVGGLL
ncbi:hypothetical protein BH24ACT9_BH24ACT9_13930 [soil metagenome]